MGLSCGRRRGGSARFRKRFFSVFEGDGGSEKLVKVSSGGIGSGNAIALKSRGIVGVLRLFSVFKG